MYIYIYNPVITYIYNHIIIYIYIYSYIYNMYAYVCTYVWMGSCSICMYAWMHVCMCIILQEEHSNHNSSRDQIRGFDVHHISLFSLWIQAVGKPATSSHKWTWDLGFDVQILFIPPSGSNASTKHSQKQTTHIRCAILEAYRPSTRNVQQLPLGEFHRAFHSHGDTPIAGWFIRENPLNKWMITIGVPLF